MVRKMSDKVKKENCHKAILFFVFMVKEKEHTAISPCVVIRVQLCHHQRRSVSCVIALLVAWLYIC